MKSFALGLVLLSSTAAFACPELSGTYMCPDENGALAETTVSQRVENGVTVYTLGDASGESEIVADGVTRTLTGKVESGNDAVMNITNSCSATALVQDATYAETDASGATVATAVMQQSFSKSSDGGIAISGTYSENGAPAQAYSGACAAK